MNSDDITLQIDSVAKHYAFHNPPDLFIRALHIISGWFQWLKEIISSLHIKIPLLGDSYSVSNFMQFLLYFLLCISLLGILYLFFKSSRLRAASAAPQNTMHIDLPDAKGWQKQAQIFAQQQDWKDACRAIYIASLQILSEKEIMSFVPTRTNYECLCILSKNKELQNLFLQFIAIVEEIWFGNKLAKESDYQQCTILFNDIIHAIDTNLSEAS